jgi:hypothetical protein
VNLVVRPHPSEDPAMWTPFAQDHENVFVDNAHTVVPWLQACTALIHNGCTTGIEAFQVGTPALAVQFTVNREFDDPFPNRLGYEVFGFEEFRSTLDRILSGEIGFADSAERRALIDHFLAGREGPLAAERMAEAFETIAAGGLKPRRFAPAMEAKLRAGWRTTVKRIKALNPQSKYHPRFQRHRFPEIEEAAIRERSERFRRTLGMDTPFEVSELSENVFSIRAGTAERKVAA